MRALLAAFTAGTFLAAACTTDSRAIDNSALATSNSAQVVSSRRAAEKERLVDQFNDAGYRVLAVVNSPREEETLIVITQRDADDRSCGSVYTSPACLFFLEPVRTESTRPRFLAEWRSPDNVDALVAESVRFVDAMTIRFQSTGGDAGCGVTSTWELLIETGKIERVKHEETCM